MMKLEDASMMVNDSNKQEESTVSFKSTEKTKGSWSILLICLLIKRLSIHAPHDTLLLVERAWDM